MVPGHLGMAVCQWFGARCECIFLFGKVEILNFLLWTGQLCSAQAFDIQSSNWNHCIPHPLELFTGELCFAQTFDNPLIEITAFLTPKSYSSQPVSHSSRSGASPMGSPGGRAAPSRYYSVESQSQACPSLASGLLSLLRFLPNKIFFKFFFCHEASIQIWFGRFSCKKCVSFNFFWFWNYWYFEVDQTELNSGFWF